MENQPVGFIGIGVMGLPMASNLIKAGVPMVVWNRTAAKAAPLAEAGVTVAATADEVFASTKTIILMLVDDQAIDATLERGTPAFENKVTGRTIIHMGTTSAAYSQGLGADIRAAGGRYVEAPVSGSRIPAEQGQLVVMLAGDESVVEDAAALIDPLCKAVIRCGPVPNALSMKLANNMLLMSIMVATVETINFARRAGLDLDQFVDILLSGQMASDILRAKAAKAVAGDYAPQAAIANVLESARLVTEAARDVGVPSPMAEVCLKLCTRAEAAGLSDRDVVALAEVFDRSA